MIFHGKATHPHRYYHDRHTPSWQLCGSYFTRYQVVPGFFARFLLFSRGLPRIDKVPGPRIGASIEQGNVTASVALRRLLSLSKKNVFYKANLHLGRILKTEHTLAHMSDQDYRKRKHQINPARNTRT